MMRLLQDLLAMFRFPSIDGEDWDHGAVLNKAEKDYLSTARDHSNLEQRQRQISMGFLRRSLRA